jgi:cytochrome c556
MQYTILSLILALSVLSQANAAESPPSSRQYIPLDQVEKDYLIGEMHKNVAGIQGILAALGQQDYQRAQQAAAIRGMATFGSNDPSLPKTLADKTPPVWKPLAKALRLGFDDVAKGIADHEEQDVILERVSKVMNYCITCHATFRFLDKP